MSAPTLMNSLFQYKAWANTEIFSALKSLDNPDHEAKRGLALRILNHVHIVDKIFAANLQRLPHEYKATGEKEIPDFGALFKSVAETDAWYLTYVSKLGPADMVETIDFKFTDGAPGRMSREEMLAHVITHGGYHRGAVGRILAELSIDPPRDIFTRFLHEAEPDRRLRDSTHEAAT